MDIDIFVSTFGVKIGDKLYSHSLLEKDDTGEKFYKFLEDNIPKTCKFVKLYCQRETLLENIIDIISYMHRYNIVLSIYIYNMSDLKYHEDWDKFNSYIQYSHSILF